MNSLIKKLMTDIDDNGFEKVSISSLAVSDCFIWCEAPFIKTGDLEYKTLDTFEMLDINEIYPTHSTGYECVDDECVCKTEPLVIIASKK